MILRERKQQHGRRFRSTATGGMAVWAFVGGLAALVGMAVLDRAHGSSPRSDAAIAVRQPRIVMIKSHRRVYLFDGGRLIKTYPADLGRAPTGPKRCENDDRTPEGAFRVVTRNAASPYHRFIGIGYPDVATAEWAFERGLISAGELTDIRRAHRDGTCPPWRTALGGGIGLHGHRQGWDWTGGCIALSNAHIEELFAVLRVGDRVEILP